MSPVPYFWLFLLAYKPFLTKYEFSAAGPKVSHIYYTLSANP